MSARNGLTLRAGFLATLFILASSFSGVGPALAEEEVAPETDPLVTEIEELTAQQAARRQEILALEKAASAATGTDQAALRSRAMTLRFDSGDQVKKLVEAVQALEAKPADASEYRSRLLKLLPATTDAIHQHYDATVAALAALAKLRDEAGPEAQLAFVQRIDRQEDRVVQILDFAADNIEHLEAFELPTEGPTAWLRDRLTDRALLAASRVDQAKIEYKDAEARFTKDPSDATSKAAGIAAGGRLESNRTTLDELAGLMERVDLETAGYRQLVSESKGQFTLNSLDAGKMGEWMEDTTAAVVEKGPGIALQALVFLALIAIFWSLSKMVRRITERAVAPPTVRLSELLKRMIVSVVSGAVLVLGFLVALSQLGIQVGPMLAGLGIAGFVLGFALQDTLGNFAAGALILAYRPYDVGDLIDCAGGVFGKVSKMNLVSTTVLTVDNQTRVVPNGKIWGDVITNVTAQRQRRVDLVFGISYSDDIPQSEEVLWSIIKEHPKVLADPEPIVKVHELADSSVNFVVRPWVNRDDYWDVYWDVTREVKIRFDREGISIPFPQQDVHFYPADRSDAAPISLDGPTRSASYAQDAPEHGGGDDSDT
jgi:small conductance mechanosensitive channel